MKHLGLLILRVVTGGLLAGHGAQKLFGSFGGPGIDGTTGMMESMGMRPGRLWAQIAGASEFFGGIFTALGFMHPLGPLMTLGPMGVAIRKVHWGKPIWVTSGGAELPVMNVAAATALLVAGPGIFSVDTILRTRLSLKGFFLTVFGLGLGLFWAINGRAPSTRELTAAGETIGQAMSEPGLAARRVRETVAS
jgi:putative oxidoreductase